MTNASQVGGSVPNSGTMTVPILGLSGKKRSGKDTAAAYVLELRGGYRYGFADPIKAMTQAAFGFDHHELEAQDRKEDIIPEFEQTYRFLWQTLGTQWGRQTVHPDIWLIVAGWKLAQKGPGMVISDVRFENEAEWIRRKGGRVIHIMRQFPDGRVDDHVSEKGIGVKYSDIQIYNDGTKEQLKESVKSVLTVLGDL